MYVFIRSELGLYTVGFYSPDGMWHPEGDYGQVEAAERVHYLNGGSDDLKEAIKEMFGKAKKLEAVWNK